MSIEISKINETYCILRCERAIAQEIYDYFSFLVPGYKFTPSYKNRLWDGYYRLAKIQPNGNVEFYNGLLHQLENFATDRDYTLKFDYTEPEYKEITKEHLEKFIEQLKLHSNNKPIEVRDYQFNGVLDYLNNRKLVLLSPTSSGKSLILYIIIRFLISVLKKEKGLIIVPNTSLVQQLYSDFEDYSSNNGWDINKYVHQIYAGQDKVSDKKMYLSTWQSIFDIKIKKYFEQFDFVVTDECHLASASSLTGIITKCINADYRIGVTGTLNGQKIHSLQLESIFGKIKKVITTKELMDKNQVTKLKIKCIVLKYPEEITKALTKIKYQDELDYIVTNVDRNKFIKNLVFNIKGNSLILYQYVEKHGDVLYKLLTESKYAKDKKIYYIHGNIKAEEREVIRKSMETENNVILLGSVGTVSTGTNIKNLHNIIFASPSKSRIRNLQAIGRILRLHDSKESAVLYDISDDLRYKKSINYTLLHFQERVKIYNEEKFDYKIHNINLKEKQ